MPATLIRDQNLTDRAKVLYAEMRLHAWESGGSICKRSRQKLADALGWGTRKVDAGIVELEDAGWIVKKRTGRASAYEVLMSANPRISSARFRASQCRSRCS